MWNKIERNAWQNCRTSDSFLVNKDVLVLACDVLFGCEKDDGAELWLLL